MTEKKLERPRQVTMAAWMIMGGSVFLVVAVFERISTLHRLETQEAVRRFLAEPPANGFGLDFEGAMTILRTMSMVTAGCAAAAAILGYHVLKRTAGPGSPSPSSRSRSSSPDSSSAASCRPWSPCRR